MPERSPNFAKVSSRALGKLKWLEEFKTYISLKRGTIRSEVDKDKRPPRKRQSSKLKSFDVTISVPGEW